MVINKQRKKNQMMFKQIGELLPEINSIYTQLDEYYQDLDQHLNNELSREMVKYIKTKKQLLGEMLKYYSKAGNKEVLQTWIQFTPDYDFDQQIEIFKLDPDMGISKVQQIVVNNETWLLEFYEYIVKTTSSSKVKELFQAILERQRKDIKNLVSYTEILQDL